MRSWLPQAFGREKGEGTDLYGSSSVGIHAALAASKCTFNETLLTFKHEWPRQAKHHGSLLMAICDGRWQQNMCSTGYMCLFQTLEFIWTKDPLVVLNASFNFFLLRLWRDKDPTRITTLEKPMTKAINNRQELHWNKSPFKSNQGWYK